MKIGFVQFNPEFGNIDKNAQKISSLISQAKAGLVVLPELCTTGYVFKSRKEAEKLSERIPSGFSCEMFSKLASAQKIYIVAGIAEKDKNKIYNSSVLIGPDGVIDVYRKLHLFWNEKKIFDKGNKPLKVNNIGKAKIGMMICFDWIFPEVTRILSLQGAQIICHPANLVLPFCQKAMITRAIENKVYIITSNRTGKEHRGKVSLDFTGKSQVVSPSGKVLIKSGSASECVKITDVDVSLADNKNITPVNNIFNDRRKEFYSRLTR